jgi:type I restriction enzyme M protein
MGDKVHLCSIDNEAGSTESRGKTGKMAKKLTDNQRDWYADALATLGTTAVVLNKDTGEVTYNSSIVSNENHVKNADPEELAHAVTIALLHSNEYNYPLSAIGHEIYFVHGSKGSKADEVDILVRDADQLPFAMMELKAAHEFDREKEDAIKNQLFGTAPLVGSPRLLVYATVEPKGDHPKLRAICIDYSKYKSYEAWKTAGEPHSTAFPVDYQDLDYEPFINGGKNDLKLDSTQADFREVAKSFHNEFFGEHPDNTVFVNLVKCLLAKIHDERTRKKEEPYEFQIFYKNGKPDSAKTVFERINSLYKAAYTRYIDSGTQEVDEINPKEFAEERVKTIVQALQGISITKGAARHGDVIGAFFEEILRSGFKQDRGMYFTHDNIVRFLIEAVDLPGLTRQVWNKSNHPENRLPYVIDPACGSGTFLLHAMEVITSTVKGDSKTFVSDHDAEQFYNARLSDAQPNYWAEAFIYGFDPKFIMAITAKVNMVLHGDGSAHIFKEDAFKPFSSYSDVRFRGANESQRTVPLSRYKAPMCETFDLVISNPPFGITLASDTRTKFSSTFTLSESVPSEGLFIERCFQLLKPGGRMGIVLPESVLNAKEMAQVRLFLYRFFNVKAIVSLPRNIFIDTPTLTSLVFAQKKTAAEIKKWDEEWSKQTAVVEACVKQASKALSASFVKQHTGQEVAKQFLEDIKPVIKESDWILKGGKSPAVLRLNFNWTNETSEEVASYYQEIKRAAGFANLCQAFVFEKVASKLSYEFPAYMVEEVGYKLSKRKEKARPNQLSLFVGRKSKTMIQNLHLAGEEYDTVYNKANPQTVLDFMQSQLKWA